MLLIRSLLVKRRPLKLVSATDDFKSTEFGLRHTTYNKANSILTLYYRTRVTPKINKLINIVYNTSVDPLLY